jgi:hypothetical protein
VKKLGFALNGLNHEIKRLMIAGSGYCRGDLNLKRTEAQLRAAGGQAAVFSKLAELTRNCHSPPEGDDCAPYLLDAFSLAHTAAVSLSASGIEGVLHPPDGPAAAIGTPLPYSQLSPIVKALTTPGAGRIEAVARGLQNGVNDLRLLPALNTALDDSCAEISRMAARALLQAGAVCLPLLERSFDINRGARGNVRRFTVLALLKGDGDFIQSVLASGAKELKKQAAALLRDMERICNEDDVK